MAFWRNRNTQAGVALALLLGLALLVGLSSAVHSHDTGTSAGHCEICRLAKTATPAPVILLVLLLTLPESGPTFLPAPVLRPQTPRRHRRSRGPPLD